MADKKEHPPSFAAMLSEVRRGTDIEAAEMLRDVVAAVKATGKSGQLTIKLVVKPAGTDEGAVDVFDSIVPKIPEKTRIGSRAFITADGDLSRTDPNSMPLWPEDIRTTPDYDPQTGEIKEAGR